MTTEFVTSADGAQIAFDRAGSGPPLVFAHGASGDRHANPELRALLQDRHSVLAYDRRGRGQSGDHRAYDFLKEADDLRAVVAQLERPPIVFGISMGARIAFEMLRDPPKLAGMVLFEAPATDAPDPAFFARLDDVRKELEAHGKEAGTILHSRLFHQRSLAEIQELRQDAQRWALRVDSFPITLREMEAVHRDCMFDPGNYPDPGCPVGLMTGDATLPFLAQSAALLGQLPFVRVLELSKGHHALPSTEPARVFAAFSKLVSDIEV